MHAHDTTSSTTQTNRIETTVATTDDQDDVRLEELRGQLPRDVVDALQEEV